MKLSLQARIVNYLRNRPNTPVAKGTIADLARERYGYTGETTGRRLRVLAEVSEYGPNPASPSYQEQLTGLELLKNARIKVEHRGKNHSFYTYIPGKSTQVYYEIINGIAYERTKEVTI